MFRFDTPNFIPEQWALLDSFRYSRLMAEILKPHPPHKIKEFIIELTSLGRTKEAEGVNMVKRLDVGGL